MRDDFRPIFPGNSHFLTIAGNYWKREIDARQFPALRREYRISDRVSVVGFEHRPVGPARGEILFLHGLEGSADAGYVVSFAQEALLQGFGVHRFNLRTCGGTETLSETMYHSGLSSDTKFVLEELLRRGLGPRFLVGFSLGGNVALKLAGELGETDLLAGVCSVSTPIDLAAAVNEIDKPANYLYVRRFVSRLRERVSRMSVLHPKIYTTAGLREVRNIWQFDDRFTAPLFGFGTAANYYATQSAVNYLGSIRVPTLAITAKDDHMVPFRMYSHAAFRTNPALTLLATEKGGHLGYLSQGKPRFWLDKTAMSWIAAQASGHAPTVGGTRHQA